MSNKTVKSILGVVAIVGGIAVGVFTQNWGLAFSIASAGVSLLSMPRMPAMAALGERQGSILENRVGPLAALPVVYGTARVGAVFADIRVDPSSSQRKRLVLVPAFCHGSQDGSGITAIDRIYFDDRLAINGTILNNPFTRPITTERYGPPHLKWGFHLGSYTEPVDSALTQYFPTEWPSTSRGRGIAYARLELWYNPDIFPSGIPNIQALIRGQKVYDPRDLTWKHSSNPALCIRDYLTAPIYGMGIPTSQIDEQSFIDMANYCDEEVVVPEAPYTQDRYTLNGWVDTSRSTEQNLAELCTSCRGQVVNEGDKWRLIIRRPRAVSGFKISEENTVEGSWQFVSPGAATAPNVGRASFIEPTHNFDVDAIQWPEPGQANPYLTADNNFEQRFEIDLPFTTNRLMAQQLLMIMLREQREGIMAVCTLKETALQLRVGDLVEVTYPTPGWVDKVFDVGALLLSPDGTVRAVLMEYEPTVYDLETQFPQPSIPDTNLPDPFSVPAPTSLVLTSAGQSMLQTDGGYVARIRAAWAKSNDPFVDYYQLQARRSAATDVDERPAPFDSTHFTSSGVTLAGGGIGLVWNDDLTTDAFHTDSATPGAYIRLDCGAGVAFEFIECRIYKSAGASYTGAWAVEYSDDASAWTSVRTGFVPSADGKNSVTWASAGAHRYWRIRLENTPGSGAWLDELQFLAAAWDEFGRVQALDPAMLYIYPVTQELWQVRIRAVNRMGVQSDWLTVEHDVISDDPRPQITTATLTNAHADTHSDVSHADVAHGDSAHTDGHTDDAHVDHTDHGDGHGDGGHDDSHGDSHGDIGDIDTDHTDTHDDAPHGDHSDGHSDGHTDTNHSDVGHQDSHGDAGAIDTDHTDAHTDEAHADHTDSALSHSDTAHTDTHSDTAHSDTAHTDSHTDAHSDGQFGVGVQLQADQDSASVRSVARKYKQYLLNGDGEVGTLGAQASSWTLGAGNNLVVANDFAYEGARALKIDNTVGANSDSYQDVVVVTGQLYEVSGYLKTNALPAGDAGFGAILSVDIVSGITSFTIVERSTVGAVPRASYPDVGIEADGLAHDWVRVFCRFTVAANGTVRVRCQLGNVVGSAGNQSGIAWFDRLRFEKAQPNAADVRAQPARNGRNVSIELIDAATGAQVLLAPGDEIRIGALAYSDLNGGGVEGPLAIANGAQFNVAPVGADLWVPT